MHCCACMAHLRMCGAFEALRSLKFGPCAVWIGFEHESFRRVFGGTKIEGAVSWNYGTMEPALGGGHGTPLESGGGVGGTRLKLIVGFPQTLPTTPLSFARTWQAKSTICRRTSPLASSAPRRGPGTPRHPRHKTGSDSGLSAPLSGLCGSTWPHHLCDPSILPPVTPVNCC